MREINIISQRGRDGYYENFQAMNYLNILISFYNKLPMGRKGKYLGDYYHKIP